MTHRRAVTLEVPDHSGLPAVLAGIADAAGSEAAWRLVEAKGGQRIFIPAQVSRRHWLARLVGHEAANRIAAHFRQESSSGHAVGIHIDMPLPPGTSRQKREAAAAWRRAVDQGHHANALAQMFGVTRRTVFRRLAQDDDERQGKLPL